MAKELSIRVFRRKELDTGGQRTGSVSTGYSTYTMTRTSGHLFNQFLRREQLKTRRVSRPCCSPYSNNSSLSSFSRTVNIETKLSGFETKRYVVVHLNLTVFLFLMPPSRFRTQNGIGH